MKVGDLVVFEFEDVYTGLVLAKNDEPAPHVEIFFFDKSVATYTIAELEDCSWEVLSESR